MPKDLFPNMEKRIKSVRAIAGHYFSFCRYCHMPSDLVMPFRIKEFELYIEPPKKWVQVYLPEDVYIDKVGKYAPEGSDIVKCKSCGTWFMIFEKNNKYLGKCYKCGLTFMIFKPKGW